jgi:hypothetical protein
MTPRTRLLAAAASTAAIALSAVGASPAAAKTCGGLPDYPGQGYYLKLTVSGISCSGGKAVMKGHYRCRTKHGIKGKCPSFNGWSCSEKRRAISTEYSSKVTCRKSGRTVVYYYQQNT